MAMRIGETDCSEGWRGGDMDRGDRGCVAEEEGGWPQRDPRVDKVGERRWGYPNLIPISIP